MNRYHSRMTTLVDLPALIAIARKHGFSLPATMPEPWTGATGQVFPCGDVVVKVPFDRPDAIEAIMIEAPIAPFARGLGVAAPALVAFNEARDILPVPYAVFRCIGDGATLATRPSGQSTTRAWQEVGRQLARVHDVGEPAAVPIVLRTFRQTPEVDPRPWVAELHRTGLFTAADAHWLGDMLDAIAPAALADVPPVLCHGDVNAANVLVDGASGCFLALIDWSGAGWLDPAWDFAGVAFDAVPALLAGHRQVAPLVSDGTAEVRILWCQIQLRLHGLRGVPADVAAEATMRRHLDGIRRFARDAGIT